MPTCAKKEDNNPYSYTPWIPQKITVTPKSLGRNIPTAILLDNYSASMSEVTTLILKSQGDHVKTIGRNSYGAQAMLTSDNEASNGGWIGNVTSYLYFYMPFSLTKDAQGNLLESVGIAPRLSARRDDRRGKGEALPERCFGCG